MRKISEKTVLKVLVNIKCRGIMGECVKGFTQKERGYILDKLEELGYIKFSPNMETTERGNKVARENLNLM